MQTKQLDAIIVSFVEDNLYAIVFTMIAIVLVQLYWVMTRQPKKLLSEEGFHSLELIDKKKVNHNTCFLRFGLLSRHQQLGLPLGQHLVFNFQPKDTEESVSRPYTPISDINASGYVDFVIKFYPNGLMSQHLEKLKVGQRLKLKGPKGKFQYTSNMKRSIGMLAGGSGITPMYQLLNHILKDPKDDTHISLIYANIAPADILLRQNLDQFVAMYPAQFDVYYVVEKNVPVGWKYGVGYITQDMIKEHCPAPSKDTLLLWCGPKPMVKVMKEYAQEIGYPEDCTFKF